MSPIIPSNSKHIPSTSVNMQYRSNYVFLLALLPSVLADPTTNPEPATGTVEKRSCHSNGCVGLKSATGDQYCGFCKQVVNYGTGKVDDIYQ